MAPMDYFWHRQGFRVTETTMPDCTEGFVVTLGGLDYARFKTRVECTNWIDKEQIIGRKTIRSSSVQS